MKIVTFDLEMSNLHASFGIVLCASFKVLGEKKIKTLRIDQYPLYKKQPWNDSELIKAIKTELLEADIIVSYNGRKFDIPFLNSRLLQIGEKPVTGIKHVDLFFISKFQLRIHNWSLDALAKHLGLPVEKTHMDGERWVKAMTGDKASLNYIIEHCILDVKVLEQVFNKVKGMVKFIKD